MRPLLFCFCLFALNAHAQHLADDLHESVASIDVTLKDFYGKEESGKVVITQFKPDGDGPFPILILNHGRSPTDRSNPPRFRYTKQARYFVERGFAVFEPTRIGYGALGTQFDPEDSGNCNSKDYAPMAEAASIEILAVLDYAKQQAYTDPRRVLFVGQSVGGYTTVATTAKNPDGLIGAINFAGGSGGNPATRPGIPCQGNRLEDMYSRFGKTARAPMLWIYTENDQYFNPSFSKAWHAAFVAAGGSAEFHLLRHLPEMVTRCSQTVSKYGRRSCPDFWADSASIPTRSSTSHQCFQSLPAYFPDSLAAHWSSFSCAARDTFDA